MENYESELFMSQEGYASIDFTLLDRPNNNIASAPEATAALLPDVHVADSSFSSFDFLDGSGVVGLNSFPRGVDENQSLEDSRNDPEKEMYEEQAMQSNAENGVAASDSEYAGYETPQSVPKPVSNVDFFAKNQALQQQEQQSQLSLFGSNGAEDHQDYLEPVQAPQQSQPPTNSWWQPDNSWMANNNQRDQSQVYNWAATTEDQRRSMRMKIGSSQINSQPDYPGALYSMPQGVNNDPSPSMYSFLPTNINQSHKMGQTAESGLNLSRMQAVQSSSNVKNPQYDFQGLLNGSGYQQGGPDAQNMTPPEQPHVPAAIQAARLREQQLRLQGQQNQSLHKYVGQSMMESPLKVSDYDFLGGDYSIKGQAQGEVGHQIQEPDAQVWRQQQQRHQQQQQQQQQQRQQQQQQLARQQPHRVNNYARNPAYEELRQHQQAQVQQHQHAQQQQLYAGSQAQALGNQFQAASSEGNLQDLPQVMPQQPECPNSLQMGIRSKTQQMGMEGHHHFLPSNPQAVNQNNAGHPMYQSNEAEAGQGPAIGYLLGQDNTFSWHQLAMKASGYDQSLYGSGAHSGKIGQQVNPYANLHGGAMPGLSGGMGKHPAASAQVNRPIPRSLGAGSSSLFGSETRPGSADHQASKANMLFGQAMQQQQQQQQQTQSVKHMQGVPGNFHQNNIASFNRQSGEDSQRRQQQSLRGNSVQQDNIPQLKLFSQSLTSMDPMQHQHQEQQQQQQQQQRMLANRNQQHKQSHPESAVQQSSLNIPQAPNSYLEANAGHYYQQEANQAGGSLQSANDTKQRPMWNHYVPEQDASQVDAPVLVPANTDSAPKSTIWAGGAGVAHTPVAENDSSLVFGRSKNQQNIWGGHSLSQNNSQSSGDFDSRNRSVQSGPGIQHGVIQPKGGHPLANQPNGSFLHQNSQQTGASVLGLADLQNRRQQELQNSQGESSWRDHSLLQASSQPSVVTNSSLQAFSDIERPQTSWKSLWQSVNQGNSTHLAEAEKEQQNTLWGQNSSHVAESQPQLPDDLNARVGNSGWSGEQSNLQTDASGDGEQQPQQTPRDEQFIVSEGPQPSHGLQDVGEMQELSNQGPTFRESLSQASGSDKDPSSASQHVDQSYQHGGSVSHHVDRDGDQNDQSSDPVGHSASSRDSMHFLNLSAEHQTALNKANVQQQGKGNAWSAFGTTSESRQAYNDTAMPTLDSSAMPRHEHQESRVNLQLSNHRTENPFSPLMTASTANLQEESPGGQSLLSMNAVAGYRHQSDMGRSGLPNGTTDHRISGWAQGLAASQIGSEQSQLEGRALQGSSVAVSAGKDNCTLPRPENTVEEHSSYTDGTLVQRAQYHTTRSNTRDAAETGRNTLELMSQQDQGERDAEGLGDQEETAMEDGGPSSGISLAHLRQGPMGTHLQRPTPSRPDSLSREQLDLQLSRNMEANLARNMEGWPQSRNLAQEFRDDPRGYAQAQMSAQSMQAAQLQSEGTPPKQSQMPERMNVFLGANRHLPNDFSRQAAHIYKNLSAAARIQFAHQLAQQSQRANAASHSADPSNMSSFVDPRSALQQHISRVGYSERPAGEQTHRAPGSAQSVDPANMSSFVDPRTALQQHMSRVGYQERPTGEQMQRVSAVAHLGDPPSMSSFADPRTALQQHMSRAGYSDRPTGEQIQRANVATHSGEPSNVSSYVDPRVAVQQHVSRLGFPERAGGEQMQRASTAAHPVDPSTMSSSMDPRTVFQQHLSRVGYPERPAGEQIQRSGAAGNSVDPSRNSSLVDPRTALQQQMSRVGYQERPAGERYQLASAAAHLVDLSNRSPYVDPRIALQQQMSRLGYPERAAGEATQRASAAAQSMDPSNMSTFVDPRMALQQHMSRVGYSEKPGMPPGLPSDKLPAVASVVAPGAAGQVGYGWSQEQLGALQQMKQAAPVASPPKKRKEYPPLIPWRITITQAATNLPTTIRSEMEWAAATNSLPDQERFNDGVETLDITGMCVKRAKRRLKFTTQLMQQLIPALPCQLFKGNTLDDHKSASFVLAKFALSEACWLATGIVASEDTGGNSNGNHTPEMEEQQLAVVKKSSPLTLSSKLRMQLTQKMTQLHSELMRLESGPSASKLSRDLFDLDKLGVVNRMTELHGSSPLAGSSNPIRSLQGREDAHFQGSVMYSSENAFPERFVTRVAFLPRIPDNVMLFPL